MKVYILFYDDGEDGPDELIGVYDSEEKANDNIEINAKKYGSEWNWKSLIQYFYVNEEIVM